MKKSKQKKNRIDVRQTEYEMQNNWIKLLEIKRMPESVRLAGKQMQIRVELLFKHCQVNNRKQGSIWTIFCSHSS